MPASCCCFEWLRDQTVLQCHYQTFFSSMAPKAVVVKNEQYDPGQTPAAGLSKGPQATGCGNLFTVHVKVRMMDVKLQGKFVPNSGIDLVLADAHQMRAAARPGRKRHCFNTFSKGSIPALGLKDSARGVTRAIFQILPEGANDNPYQHKCWVFRAKLHADAKSSLAALYREAALLFPDLLLKGLINADISLPATAEASPSKTVSTPLQSRIALQTSGWVFFVFEKSLIKIPHGFRFLFLHSFPAEQA